MVSSVVDSCNLLNKRKILHKLERVPHPHENVTLKLLDCRNPKFNIDRKEVKEKV
jgi:hypothetical protein